MDLPCLESLTDEERTETLAQLTFPQLCTLRSQHSISRSEFLRAATQEKRREAISVRPNWFEYFSDVPPGLLSKTAWSRLGRRVNDKSTPVAFFRSNHGRRPCPVYRIEQTSRGGSTYFDPAWAHWNCGTVANIARLIQEKIAFHLMPIFADALEDAGCDNARMLHHIRNVPHSAACWIIELYDGDLHAGRMRNCR